MRKWTLALVALLLLGGTAMAQQIEANRLCISNGSEYYVGGVNYAHLNKGVGKYYPSYSHWAAQGICEGGTCFWPWKVRGWAWGGMQAILYGPTWYWLTTLTYSIDNPWTTSMTWPYPLMHFLGFPHSGFPNNIHGRTYPNWFPSAMAKRFFILPSSNGGIDTYMNLFVWGQATFMIPTTSPFYGWNFAFTVPAASAFTLPSGISIYEAVFESLGPNGQYCLLSGNEYDCTGNTPGTAGGYKGVNPLFLWDDLYIYGWLNSCTGADTAYDMCLFLEDAVTIPVNLPGTTNWANPYPYWGYQFDVGTGTVTPNSSSGVLQFQAQYEDYSRPGRVRFVLVGSPWIAFVPLGTPAPALPYGPVGNRLPHGWDIVTQSFLGIWPFTQSQAPHGLYPACIFGTTIGSLGGPFGPLPVPNNFGGVELRICGADLAGAPCTASYMVTFF